MELLKRLFKIGYKQVIKHRAFCVFSLILSTNSLAVSPQKLPPDYQQALTAAKQVLSNQSISVIQNNLSFMRNLSKKPDIEDSFHVVNICSLAERMKFWQAHLPKVGIHYALKTNHDKVISTVMASLGAGFDCASVGEMRQVLELGVHPDKIVFSHPRKPILEIAFAEKNHIKKMMFDSTEEIDKIIRYSPSFFFIL